MTPDEWLASFESKVAEVQQKAAAFKQNLEASAATETSADGALRVTVAPNGALTDLSIADVAMRGSGAELAARIMRLARTAQRQAATLVAEAFAPLAGDSAETAVAPPNPVPQPPRQPSRPRSGSEDDEDFSSDEIFGRRGEW